MSNPDGDRILAEQAEQHYQYEARKNAASIAKATELKIELDSGDNKLAAVFAAVDFLLQRYIVEP